ncbi:MAG: ATP-binding domain-containing protein, partial [candidate division NC10 bacterium]
YAVTVHKYQGSEAPIIVMPIHRAFGPFLMQRNLFYTAVSRARRVCILVGQRDEIPKIIGRNQQQRRFTRLKAMLQ